MVKHARMILSSYPNGQTCFYNSILVQLYFFVKLFILQKKQKIQKYLYFCANPYQIISLGRYRNDLRPSFNSTFIISTSVSRKCECHYYKIDVCIIFYISCFTNVKSSTYTCICLLLLYGKRSNMWNVC